MATTEKTKPKRRAKRGRPTKYSKRLASLICDQLSEGASLRTVCAAENMPDKSTVFRWLFNRKDFCDQYTRAKEESADAMAEDVLDIADDGINDYMKVYGDDEEVYGWKLNGDAIQRSRLRVETRKWLMAKMKPKKYGDKIEHSGDVQVQVIPIMGGASTNPSNE